MYKFKSTLLFFFCFTFILFSGKIAYSDTVSEPNPTSEPTVTSDSTLISEPTASPEPTPTSEPVTSPEPTPTSEPVTSSEPNPIPKEIPLLSQKELTIVYGKKGNVPKIKNLPANYKISYKATNTSVATVSNKGIITPKGIGNCKINIKITDLSYDKNTVYTLPLNIHIISNIKKITYQYLESSSITLAVSQTRKLDYTISPKTSKIPTLVWKSSNPDVATVSTNGIIKAKKQGKAKISVFVKGNKAISDSIKVTVTKRADSFSPKKLSIVDPSSSRYTYTAMETDIRQLQKKYGDRIHVTTIGNSYDNRKICEITLGNPNATKNIVINSAIHAREYMTSQLTMRQLEYYCSNYYNGIYKGRYYSELFDNVCIHLIPMLNPDGVSISQFGLKGIHNATLRRNVEKIGKKYGNGSFSFYKKWKANARGVDLNRNFSPGWKTSARNYKHPNSAYYKGTMPASEKETQAIIKTINLQKPVATLNYHAMGSVIYWYFGQKGELLNRSKKLVSEIKRLTNYMPINGSYNKKDAAGLGDWTSICKHIPTATIEIGRSQCPVSIKEFPSIWNKNKEIWVATASLYD
ncbi:M14 family zinc carboxypeptidase [Velocimicrobium porci]|uniref:Peptidase M14 domain-containing protein n=1 Tax=Velocimicrobium porci TaxID=2606634 RepID=A0A6L5Y1H1_9FIRM|nr:M14 family zinc carboxypeptidase [Velocimicrobium porci]MSS63973.1 hypothetical protein [Velocimicrobium porci]